MVVQRRDGPRRLREIDDDDDYVVSYPQNGDPVVTIDSVMPLYLT